MYFHWVVRDSPSLAYFRDTLETIAQDDVRSQISLISDSHAEKVVLNKNDSRLCTCSLLISLSPTQSTSEATTPL